MLNTNYHVLRRCVVINFKIGKTFNCHSTTKYHSLFECMERKYYLIFFTETSLLSVVTSRVVS